MPFSRFFEVTRWKKGPWIEVAYVLDRHFILTFFDAEDFFHSHLRICSPANSREKS